MTEVETFSEDPTRKWRCCKRSSIFSPASLAYTQNLLDSTYTIRARTVSPMNESGYPSTFWNSLHPQSVVLVPSILWPCFKCASITYKNFACGRGWRDQGLARHLRLTKVRFDAYTGSMFTPCFVAWSFLVCPPGFFHSGKPPGKRN